MSFLILVLCVTFFGGLLYLVTQNGTPVDVEILSYTCPQVPLSVVMTICLLGGIGFAALISFLEGARLRLQNRRLCRQVGRLELQVRQLRLGKPVGRDARSAKTSPPLDYPHP